MKIGSDNEDDSHNGMIMETESATGVYDVLVYYTIFILF